MSETLTWNGTITQTAHIQTELIQGILNLTPSDKPDLFGDISADRRRLVVLDATVQALYPGIAQLYERFDIEYRLHTIPSGPEAKTWETVEAIHDAMDEFGVPRFGEVDGWGGGRLHDVLGVAAKLYRRGIDYRYFATTLVGGGDAMFAAKCAIERIRSGNAGTRWGKNRIGAYHAARYSAVDNVTFFGTLTPDDVLEGYAEVLKWAICGDLDLFRTLETHGPSLCREKFAGTDPITRRVMAGTIGGMVGQIYGMDDSGRNNALEEIAARPSYIGHTLSPGMEPDIQHGIAVTFDILITTMIARRRGLLSTHDATRIAETYRAARFPLWHPVLEQRQRLLAALEDTTLHRGGYQLWPTPIEIGTVTFLNDVSESDIAYALDELHAVNQGYQESAGRIE
jgi:3-dehydroquinate synthase